MEYPVEEIKKAVRVILTEDENVEKLIEIGLSPESDDTMALENDTLIERLIPIAVDRVHCLAPLWMVRDAAESFADGFDASEGTEKYSVLSAPKDFLLLVSLKLNRWDRPVTDLVSEDSNMYGILKSKWGVGASAERPAAAITAFDNDRRIEAYPAGEGVERALYVAQSKIKDGKVLIADNCKDAVAYMTANLYYTSINESDRAAMMAGEVREILGLGNGEQTNTGNK